MSWIKYVVAAHIFGICSLRISYIFIFLFKEKMSFDFFLNKENDFMSLIDFVKLFHTNMSLLSSAWLKNTALHKASRAWQS